MTYSKIQKLIYSILTENTGQAICDSGGAYGRNWERNQKKSIDDFNNEPVISLDLWGDIKDSSDISFSVSLFHYLPMVLELDEICNIYNRKKCNNWDSDIYGVSDKQRKWLDKMGFEIGRSWNTYNGEMYISQILQGTVLAIGSIESSADNYILLQVHNGCDARGGYTDAKLFKLTDKWQGINPTPDIYGYIDGIQVDTMYNGVSLTDENGNVVPCSKDSKISLELAEIN